MAVIKEKSVLALGFFDSIHKGHRYLLEKGRKIAERYLLDLTILTFNDDFLINLNRNDREVYLLEERLELLNKLGFCDVMVLNPTKDFLNQTEIEFMEYLLSFNPVAIIAGNDYTFGKHGKGNITVLKDYMLKRNIEVNEIDLQKFHKQKISSTVIKKLISDGKIERANQLLTERYFVSGIVVKGRGVGGTIGIPTANIELKFMKQLPKEGIYKTSTEVDGILYKSITNVGIHPTFNDKNFNIETLLLNFSGNLYNKRIKVYFDVRIRDIIKFDSADELVAQIKKDIKHCYDES